MLSNNNMLTTGGNRQQRARGTVRVSEPSHGFFIAGSSIEAMNGVYVRRNPPRKPLYTDGKLVALYYEHEEGLWHMSLNQLAEAGSEYDDESEDDDDDYYYYKPPKKKPTHEWVFLDEFNKERFTHEGDTIVPGAGVRWKHCHPKAEKAVGAGAGATKSKAAAGIESWLSPYANESELEPETTAVAEIKPDNEDELPWQVIAILDLDMVQQLLWSSEHRKQKVREAKEGKNVPAPVPASLEGSFAPGRWLFRVVADEGIPLRVGPSDSDEVGGRREKGEYLRGVKLGVGGDWLCLDAIEDTAMNSNSRSRGYDRFYNAAHSRRQLWVKLYTGSGGDISSGLGGSGRRLCEEISADETAVLGLRGVGDDISDDADATAKEAGGTDAAAAAKSEMDALSAGSGMTGDLFDRPFVPRMEDSDNLGKAAEDNEREKIEPLRPGEEDPALVMLKDARASVLLHCSGAPIGAAVEIAGLVSTSGMQYNGVTGVVVAPLDTKSGRQGVRLDAPFAGKILACRLSCLLFSERIDEIEEEANDDSVTRAARALGIPLHQLGLEKPPEGGGGGCHAAALGWGFAGAQPSHRLGCALRASIRDAQYDPATKAAAQDAADTLYTAMSMEEKTQDVAAAVDNSWLEKSLTPDFMLRSGALGERTAAAMVSASSPLSLEERESGVMALQEILQDETKRSRAADLSFMVAQGESSEGGDELLLRLGVVQTLMENRRETEALHEARMAHKFDKEVLNSGGSHCCPAVLLLLGRCLLRLGQRAEGIGLLEQAETGMPIVEGVNVCKPVWLQPLWEWGRAEAAQLLLAHRTAEKCRSAAVEAYARGSFVDAAALYDRALALLKLGFPDDKRGRSAALADRAGCLRRARKLDDAVADLDAALRLFPRYTRALFRRAACLLEAGKAEEAIEGFKALYRVDRDWPQLSEWLIRAFSLRKRQQKGYKRGDEDDEDEGTPGGVASPSTPSTTQAADILAKEVDHYQVLGVSTDATEKQLKTAYRMRSLQFHPDRKEGHTAAFQRIAEAYQVLMDEDKRRAYDEGGDIKVKRGKRDQDSDEDDSSDDEEEHKTTMREEVEREFYPERYHFHPFGDPFINKRKREAQKNAKKGKPAWQEEEW